MKVLPARENFLLISPVSLLGKMRIKPLFYRGAHRGLPITELFVADSVELSHEGAILMETDGEVVPLEQSDFPLVVRKIPDVLSVLK